MSIDKTDIFMGILSERINSTRSNSHPSKLSLAQKILSFDPRLSSNDKNPPSITNQSIKATKATALMNQFNTSLMETSLISYNHPSPTKDLSVEMKDVVEEILRKVIIGIIQVQLQEAFNDHNTLLVEKQSITNELAKELCDLLLSRMITRAIKRVGKYGLQTAYFSFLIYKGLILQLIRSLILSNAFNIQYKASLLNSISNEVIMNCIKKMCIEIMNIVYEQDTFYLMNAKDQCTIIPQLEENKAISKSDYAPRLAKEIFERVLHKYTNAITYSSYLDLKTTSDIVDEQLIEKSTVRKYVQTIVINKDISFAIYNSLLHKIQTDYINSVTNNFISDSSIIFNSLISNTISKEITGYIQEGINAIESTHKIINTIYAKIIIKVFSSEIATIRNLCVLHAKTIQSVYENTLVITLIKEIISEILSNLVKSSKNSMKTKITTMVYDDLENKLNVECMQKNLMNMRIAVIVFDEMLNKVCRMELVRDSKRSRSKVNEGLSKLITNKLIERRVNFLVESISLSEIAITSLTNSMLLLICSGVIEGMWKEISEDVMLEREIGCMRESPRVLQKTIVSSGNNGIIKCKRCKALLSKMAMKLHKCHKANTCFNTLEKVNQELLRLLEQIEKKELSFPESLHEDFKAAIMEAFKINWNVSALERLELILEKIVKGAQDKEFYEQVDKFCKTLIDVISEKIRILELRKEEPSEDESGDKEFIEYFCLLP